MYLLLKKCKNSLIIIVFFCHICYFLFFFFVSKLWNNQLVYLQVSRGKWSGCRLKLKNLDLCQCTRRGVRRRATQQHRPTQNGCRSRAAWASTRRSSRSPISSQACSRNLGPTTMGHLYHRKALPVQGALSANPASALESPHWLINLLMWACF